MKAYEDASETVERLTGYDAITGLYKYEKFLKLAGDAAGEIQLAHYASKQATNLIKNWYKGEQTNK